MEGVLEGDPAAHPAGADGAVIFRGLDALRIFDLIYVLTLNNVHQARCRCLPARTCSSSTRFAYGSAASDMLFVILALLTILFMWLGRVRLDGGH